MCLNGESETEALLLKGWLQCKKRSICSSFVRYAPTHTHKPLSLTACALFYTLMTLPSGDDHSVLLWDTRSGKGPVLQISRAHQDNDVHCVDWSPHRLDLLVSGGYVLG